MSIAARSIFVLQPKQTLLASLIIRNWIGFLRKRLAKVFMCLSLSLNNCGSTTQNNLAKMLTVSYLFSIRAK